MAINKYQEAADDFTVAVSIDRNYAAAWANRGDAFSKLGDVEKARQSYRAALSLQPNDPQAVQGLKALSGGAAAGDGTATQG